MNSPGRNKRPRSKNTGLYGILELKKETTRAYRAIDMHVIEKLEDADLHKKPSSW